MQHFYEINYYVDYIVRMDDSKNSILSLNIIEVFKLMETNISGFDGWSYNDTSNKTLIITPQNWKNIALINIHENKLSDLIGGGAELKDSRYIFDNIIDAKIQMAFTASKYGIDSKNINQVTNGILSQKVYKELLELFYEEFPEKFI